MDHGGALVAEVGVPVIGTVAWLVLAAAALALEWRCRASHGRRPDLVAIAAAPWSRPLGRVILISVWTFVGWHLFARYTVPR